MNNKLPPISEEAEQIALVEWLDMNGLKYSAIPNSTYTTSWSVKARNKRTGLHAGLPDLLIALPGVGIVFIELKKQKTGRVSDAQKEWITILNQCPGTEAHVCYGADEAMAVISEILRNAKASPLPTPPAGYPSSTPRESDTDLF